MKEPKRFAAKPCPSASAPCSCKLADLLIEDFLDGFDKPELACEFPYQVKLWDPYMVGRRDGFLEVQITERYHNPPRRYRPTQFVFVVSGYTVLTLQQVIEDIRVEVREHHEEFIRRNGCSRCLGPFHSDRCEIVKRQGTSLTSESSTIEARKALALAKLANGDEIARNFVQFIARAQGRCQSARGRSALVRPEIGILQSLTAPAQRHRLGLYPQDGDADFSIHSVLFTPAGDFAGA
jgi:hypothetical protein